MKKKNFWTITYKDTGSQYDGYFTKYIILNGLGEVVAEEIPYLHIATSIVDAHNLSHMENEE